MTVATRPDLRRLGVDVGGTFTDLVLIDEATGDWRVTKVLSTPDDPSLGMMHAVDQAIPAAERGSVGFFGHGTTTATNAFLTRRGARTALLATAGFEDVLEFRRMDRSGVLDPYDLQIDHPAPLVPGRRRMGVRERIGLGGVVVEELSDAEIDRVIEELRALDPEAVAVSLLWSFANPAHELRLVEAIERALPGVYVTRSSGIDPSIMEYERSSTTVLNAYVGPLIARYMHRLQEETAGRQLPEPLIMQSNGGLTSLPAAVSRASALLESGPAGGVTACAYLSGRVGLTDLLAIDMGGTSFDVALILNGEPQQVLACDLEGYALRTPMIDIRSIGAGGGSIAWIDEGGALRVGPQSAGASPGPAAYGLGGERPTVTDANVVLGYIRPEGLAGGSLAIHAERAAEAIRHHVAVPLGLDVVGAARAVRAVVDANMANTMRLILSERGFDPRDFDLIAYGGAGPLHAASLARELEMRRALIPPHPGAISALGVATADLAHDFARPVMLPLDEVRPDALETTFAEMETEAVELLSSEGIEPGDRRLNRSVVARYLGQLHDLELEMPPTIAQLANAFHARHRAVFGFDVPDEAVMVVSARIRATGRILKPEPVGAGSAGAPVPVRSAQVWFEGAGLVDCPIFERASWSRAELAGPAVITEYDSTTIVLPGQGWSTDGLGNIFIEEQR